MVFCCLDFLTPIFACEDLPFHDRAVAGYDRRIDVCARYYDLIVVVVAVEVNCVYSHALSVKFKYRFVVNIVPEYYLLRLDDLVRTYRCHKYCLERLAVFGILRVQHERLSRICKAVVYRPVRRPYCRKLLCRKLNACSVVIVQLSAEHSFGDRKIIMLRSCAGNILVIQLQTKSRKLTF